MSSGRGRPTKLRGCLGDGVYAAFDGFGVWLTTEDGIRVTDAIYLEPAVFLALEKFMADAWKATGDYLTALDLKECSAWCDFDQRGPALLTRCLDMIQEALENVLPLAKRYAAEAVLAGRQQERDALQQGKNLGMSQGER